MRLSALTFRRTAPLLLALGLALFLSGCSTPGSRIAKNPELFASFPLSVQERIRAGEIDIGFTREMVMMAVGKPHHTYLRTTKAGESEIWAYTDYKQEFERQLVDATFSYKDKNGITRTGHDKVWAEVKTKVEFDVLRIELTDHRVSGFERVK
jgi:hypothetical protein